MQRRGFWAGVLAALALKYVGASWDVSSHFRTTQDTANPAHIVNLVGNFLLAGLLLAQWRTHRPEERRPLLAAIGGMCVVGLAVPLDIAWHKVHGLDLTTWSPTHMLLFYGTAFACFGLVLLLLAHVGWRWNDAAARPRLPWAAWLLLTVLLARTLAPLLFPASFNEFAAVGAENLRTGQSLYAVDGTLVDFAAGFHDLPNADLPHALYPGYTLAVAAAFATAVRRLSRVPGLATAAAAAYVAGRVASDVAAHAAGFPTSAIPAHALLAALAVDAVWSVPRIPRVVTSSALATGLAYAYWSWPGPAPARVPLDWHVAPFALAVTLAGAMLAGWAPVAPVLALGRRLDRLVPAWLVRSTTKGSGALPAPPRT